MRKPTLLSRKSHLRTWGRSTPSPLWVRSTPSLRTWDLSTPSLQRRANPRCNPGRVQAKPRASERLFCRACRHARQSRTSRTFCRSNEHTRSPPPLKAWAPLPWGRSIPSHSRRTSLQAKDMQPQGRLAHSLHSTSRWDPRSADCRCPRRRRGPSPLGHAYRRLVVKAALGTKSELRRTSRFRARLRRAQGRKGRRLGLYPRRRRHPLLHPLPITTCAPNRRRASQEPCGEGGVACVSNGLDLVKPTLSNGSAEQVTDGERLQRTHNEGGVTDMLSRSRLKRRGRLFTR